MALGGIDPLERLKLLNESKHVNMFIHATVQLLLLKLAREGQLTFEWIRWTSFRIGSGMSDKIGASDRAGGLMTTPSSVCVGIVDLLHRLGLVEDIDVGTERAGIKMCGREWLFDDFLDKMREALAARGEDLDSYPLDPIGYLEWEAGSGVTLADVPLDTDPAEAERLMALPDDDNQPRTSFPVIHEMKEAVEGGFTLEQLLMEFGGGEMHEA